MRKTYLIMLAIILVFSLAACGDNSATTNPVPSTESESPTPVESEPSPDISASTTLIFADLIPELDSITEIYGYCGRTSYDFNQDSYLGRVFVKADEGQMQRMIDCLSAFETIEVEPGVINDIESGKTLFGNGILLLIRSESGECGITMSEAPDNRCEFYITVNSLPETTLSADDVLPQTYYKGQFESDQFLLTNLAAAMSGIFLDTADRPNTARAYLLDDETPTPVINKQQTAVMKHILDGTIWSGRLYEGDSEPEFDLKIVVGDTIYLIDISSGVFSRELDGETVLGVLEDNWLQTVCVYSGMAFVYNEYLAEA